jgi:hypothetical protein
LDGFNRQIGGVGSGPSDPARSPKIHETDIQETGT